MTHLHQLKPQHTFVYRGKVFCEYIIDLNSALAVDMNSKMKRPYTPLPGMKIKIIWTEFHAPDVMNIMVDMGLPIAMFHLDANPDDRENMISARKRLMQIVGDHFHLPGHGTPPVVNPNHS